MLRNKLYQVILQISIWLFTISYSYAAIQNISIQPSNKSAKLGDNLSISIVVDSDVNVSAYQIDLQYDPNVLTAINAINGVDTSGWKVLSNTNQLGLLKIGLVSETTATVTGSQKQVALVNFIVKSTATPSNSSINLTQVLLDETALTSSQITNGSVTILSSNQAPVLDFIGTKQIQAGKSLSFNISASDPDFGNTLIFSASSLPSGASFDPTLKLFSWTPSSNQASIVPYNIVFSVSDGALSDSETVAVTVNSAAVNGSCGTTNNACIVGSLVDTADSSTNYLWNCTGANGGSTANCSLAIPVNGQCSTTLNTCSVGSLSDVADSSTEYLWNCTGSNGGTTANCSKAIPPAPINGSCGITNNACSVGSLVDTADSSTNYLWNCAGANGGSTASCSIAKPINGSCGTTNNSCSVGSLVDTADSSTNYLWNCAGANGGSTASCSIAIPVNGQCSTVANQCKSGEVSNLIETTLDYTWDCLGQNEGTTANCSITKPQDGVCSSILNTCESGAFEDKPDNRAEHKWSCKGLNGGKSTSCRLNKNSQPKIMSKLINVDQDSSITVDIDSEDEDGDVLSYDLVNQPSNGKVSVSSNGIYYEPNPGFSGTDKFTIIASDGIDQSTPAEITVNVNKKPNIPPSIQPIENITISSIQTTQVSIYIDDTETPLNKLGVKATSSNPILISNIPVTGEGNTRTLTIKPSANQTNSTVITVEVFDGEDSTSTSFVVNVTAVQRRR